MIISLTIKEKFHWHELVSFGVKDSSVLDLDSSSNID